MSPLISVCIPAYNRANVLPQLLDSIVSQNFGSYEIVICENRSPEREKIRAIVDKYRTTWSDRIRYVENERNLGYDGNIRNLVDQAHGEYCLFMGNDDLMSAGALASVAQAIRRHSRIGVVLRAYAAFDGTPENINQEFRYFPDERFFPAGAETIATVFRRSVSISGMVLHCETAARFGTNRFDGSLLYHMYLAANVLVEMNAVYLPTILALYRNGGVPDFGNSEAERGKFVPREHTPESTLHFVREMFVIAEFVEASRGVRIYRNILNDVGNYSYPILAIHADRPMRTFIRYWWGLAAMGLWRNVLFHGYFLALLTLGWRRMDALIRRIKQKVGHTPTIGRVFRGRKC